MTDELCRLQVLQVWGFWPQHKKESLLCWQGTKHVLVHILSTQLVIKHETLTAQVQILTAACVRNEEEPCMWVTGTGEETQWTSMHRDWEETTDFSNSVLTQSRKPKRWSTAAEEIIHQQQRRRKHLNCHMTTRHWAGGGEGHWAGGGEGHWAGGGEGHWAAATGRRQETLFV